ncbi:PQQ-dependent sugar dehydrogenase [Luteimonas sp. MC1828]|uniref:PQQ-dependent sugar dehydrogenase n=1 Tax=Luteimonas sp. MC1828 TaxID=2799787 RepID=UPI0018F1E608|nr:PQQ-dependent sugar dehydrogenase [Luteimonas sp. MC1828]MBJ7575723.1 PQQ-dependent sugar dehydrogenase [Luteimonas sp. MC1828]
MSKGLFRASIVAAILLAWSTAADASRFGRDGFSGNPGTNNGATCTACHAPGAALPTVTISGPQTLDANTIAEYTVTIAGGPGVTGGVGVSSSRAAGSFEAVGSDVHVVGTELSHTQPKAFAAGTVSFRFRWRAPAWNGPITLYAAGNSSNGQLSLLGDGIGTRQLTVNVQNGSAEPPPPQPPPPAAASLAIFATGLSQPVVITHAGDARLFVAEQPGRIRVIDNGVVLPTPFLDITARVDDAGNEQGLLGLAFHPEYASNGYFYVNYIFDPPASTLDRTRISRFTVGANANVADPASEVVLMEFEQPYSNHNGGDLQFGPDGYLYIASGDGGSGGDPQNNAQNPGRPLGKLLRIDVDGGGGTPDCNLVAANHYGIPPGNAYTDGDGGAGCDEIFALGLRNPWRIAFDAVTGNLWIADVGQSAREEINFVPAGTAAGLNFGWRCYEGDQPYNTAGCNGAYFAPLVTTSHSAGNCSITGGRVYRGSASPALAGRYFFTDYCNTAIRTVTFANGQPVVESPIPAGAVGQPVAFGEDVFGELYVASLTGTVYRIVGAGDTPPSQLATLSNQCLHALGTGLAGGTKLAAWPCNGSAAQRWILRADGSLLNPASGGCVDVPNGDTRPGAVQLRLSACNGQAAQRFTTTAANELRGVGGLCMDESRKVRRRVQMYTCDGSDHQVWFFAPSPARAAR